jgi:GTP cyclohydrolase II
MSDALAPLRDRLAAGEHRQQAEVKDRHGDELAWVVDRASLPTRFGEFEIVAFGNRVDGKDHVALVRGDVAGKAHVPTRIHSECLTGDVLGSLRCDCRDQLEKALQELSKRPFGLLLYMRQEGRGIGLANKIRAYALQDQGLDTVEANLQLGFDDDLRDYSLAAALIQLLGVKSVDLWTNNPKKIFGLKQAGLEVARRVAHEVPANRYNRFYLETKRRKSGHLLSLKGLGARG